MNKRGPSEPQGAPGQYNLRFIQMYDDVVLYFISGRIYVCRPYRGAFHHVEIICVRNEPGMIDLTHYTYLDSNPRIKHFGQNCFTQRNRNKI